MAPTLFVFSSVWVSKIESIWNTLASLSTIIKTHFTIVNITRILLGALLACWYQFAVYWIKSIDLTSMGLKYNMYWIVIVNILTKYQKYLRVDILFSTFSNYCRIHLGAQYLLLFPQLQKTPSPYIHPMCKPCILCN